ncbi:serine/threonine-protein kinase Chk1-like [Anneissia japonica]|uniref:serine/threonine-protein kinase Chk1-like n=1 Tax=Anneissia japonica TaxID=1529436 RepID=UPI0014258021|nr:serine/threonine-protein kinase Chk1-like [Anneissia japonica]
MLCTVQVSLEKFKVNECLIWMRVEHQYIVPLWGVVRHDNTVMMLSKYIQCTPLSVMIDMKFKLSDRNIVKWIKQLLCVLEYIHSMNIVHMDIKPANILLTYDEDIVLIDWGLAMELNNNGQQLVSNPRGTMYFMAPEVCRKFVYRRANEL